MPASNINTGNPVRFNKGGTCAVVDGSNEYVLQAVEPGTLKFSGGGWEHLSWTQGDVLQAPVRGAEQPFDLEVTIKYVTGSRTGSATTGILDMAGSIDATSALHKTFSVKITNPDYDSATTGDIITFTKCVFDGYPQYSAGKDFDTLVIKFKSYAPLPTLAAM